MTTNTLPPNDKNPLPVHMTLAWSQRVQVPRHSIAKATTVVFILLLHYYYKDVVKTLRIYGVVFKPSTND